MPPLRPDLAQAVNLVRAFVDAEFVATTHRVNFGEWGSRLTTEADYKDFSRAQGVLTRPDFEPPMALLVGPEPAIRLDVLEPADRRLLLRLGGFLGRNQTVQVRFNGTALGDFTLRKDGESQMVRVDVPADLQVRGSNTVSLAMGDTETRTLQGAPVPLPLSGALLAAHFLLPGEPEGVPAGSPPAQLPGVEKDLRPGRSSRVLLLTPGVCARVAFPVPEASRALLHLSVGRLDVPLEVSLLLDDGRRVLLTQLDTTDVVPRDVRHDLSRWRGQVVRLDLRALEGRGRVELSELQVMVPEEELAPGDADDAGADRLLAREVVQTPAVDRLVPTTAPDGGPWSFLVVVLDALARARTSTHGPPAADGAPATTPILDRLATRGLVPERASAPASYTLASVGSLLTGQHPLTHGVVEHGDGQRVLALADETPRLARTLAAGGWRTGAWLTNPNTSGQHGYGQGFDHWEELFAAPGLFDQGVAAEHLPPRLAAFLEEVGEEPFLAYAHVFEPHAPWTAPEQDRAAFLAPYDGPARGDREWIDAFRTSEIDLEADDWRHLEQLYAARVHQADRALGALLAALEASGRADDTILLVTSDHGEALGEHGLLEHGDHVFAEQLDVPFVLVAPDGARGALSGQATLEDVAPTLLGLAGLPVPEAMEGRDLLAGDPAVERPLLARGYGRLPQLSWTRWPWKLVVDTGTRERWLFDLSRDPGEQEDLSERRPATFAWLYRELVRAVTERVEARQGAQVVETAGGDHSTQIQQLGYAGGDLEPGSAPADDPALTVLRSLLQRS